MAGGLTPARVGPFLARLVRLDPAALVRLRPAGPEAIALWGRVPWGVLVTRTVAGLPGPDTCVPAEALLQSLVAGNEALPPARDRDWRWPLPPRPGTPVEVLPAGEVHQLGVAAAQTLAAARGRVGERMLRDALLDHVPIVVTAGDRKIGIRQGMVQALLRMAFMRSAEEGEVTVCISGTWVGLAAEHGSVWWQTTPALAIRTAE